MIVETVGAGQSDVARSVITWTTAVVVVPGMSFRPDGQGPSRSPICSSKKGVGHAADEAELVRTLVARLLPWRVEDILETVATGGFGASSSLSTACSEGKQDTLMPTTHIHPATVLHELVSDAIVAVLGEDYAGTDPVILEREEPGVR